MQCVRACLPQGYTSLCYTRYDFRSLRCVNRRVLNRTTNHNESYDIIRSIYTTITRTYFVLLFMFRSKYLILLDKTFIIHTNPVEIFLVTMKLHNFGHWSSPAELAQLNTIVKSKKHVLYLQSRP